MAVLECTMREMEGYVEDCMFAGAVPFVKGSPGIGKSAKMRSLTKKHNLELIDHRVSTSAPEDFSGLPRFRPDGRAEFAPFGDLFPLEGDPLPEGKAGWMLFLDEMNSGTRMVQAASYKLLLDKMTGQKKLHENVVITAAGNHEADKAIVEKLSTAIKSRIVTLNAVLNFQEFLMDVALPQNWDSRIVAYLSAHEGELMDFKPNLTDDNFCCPRTWETINKFISGPGAKPVDDSRLKLFSGTITSGSAAKFIAFCKLQGELVSVQQILADPENCPLPDTSDKMWMVVSQLINKIDEKAYGKMCTYVSRMPLSFRILFGRAGQVQHPKLRTHPEFAKFAIQIAKYLK